MRINILIWCIIFFGINTTNINAQIRLDKQDYISPYQGNELPVFCENKVRPDFNHHVNVSLPKTSLNVSAHAPTRSNVNCTMRVRFQSTDNYHDKIPDAYDRAQRMVNAVSADQRWCVYKQLDSMVPSLTSYLRSSGRY